MKNNFFRKTAPVIPTPSTSLGAGSAKRSGGISRLTHNTTIKTAAHVSRFLGKLGMTVVLLCPVVLAAQNGVKVSNLNVNAGTVTFDVSWDKNAHELQNIVWLDSVWVFVDYNAGGIMKRLPLSAGATLTATSEPGVGRVIQYSDNDKGVWVVGNARSAGSFSATVKLLTATANVAGACAYASNYPPVGEYLPDGKIKFTGTPMYKIVLEETASGNTFTAYSDGTYTVHAGDFIKSFTDATGAPGIIKCIPSAVYDLKASATDFCTGDSVTFALSNSASGQVYRLYKNGEAVDVLIGIDDAATFTGTFAGAGTYTALVDADGTQCASMMHGSHTVIEHLVPNIALSGGDASQSVDIDTPVTAITFTASNGATAISRLGELPSGIDSDNTSDLVYTISGTPSAAGNFPYTITATGDGACTFSISGTITVSPISPIYAASTQTWTVSGTAGTQTWSDYINVPACKNSSWINSTTTASCKNTGAYGYMYNLSYALAYKDELCPEPWRVPISDDFCKLDQILCNTPDCENRKNNQCGVSVYENQLGMRTMGFLFFDGTVRTDKRIIVRSLTSTAAGSCSLYICDGDVRPIYCYRDWASHGYSVRCVRD